MAKQIGRKTLPTLYLLTPDYDAKGYCPWHSLEDVYNSKRYSQLCETAALAETWKKFSAKFEKEKKQGDFMFSGGSYFALPKAFAIVSEFLGDAVEGLPVKVIGGGHDVVYLLHALVTAKVSKEATVKRYTSGKIMRVEEYAFAPAEISGKHFFLSEGKTIVSGEFRAIIEDAKLTGIGFDPLPGYTNK